MKTHLPSLRALQTPDDEPLREELSLLVVREQVAVVRAFTDEVERLTFGGRMCGTYEQLVEELARLGCRILETAATASRTVEPPTPSDTRQDRGANEHSPRTTDRESGMWVVATPSREVSR